MQPATDPFGEGGDVSAGVQICVQSEPVPDAFELPSCSTAWRDVTASRAYLGRMVWINDHHLLSQSLALDWMFRRQVFLQTMSWAFCTFHNQKSLI